MHLEQEDAFADEALDRAVARASLDARDRALAYELVYGVLRHRGLLDWRLNHVSDRPIERAPALIRNALRLGAYQAFHLERIPVSAAVNESVRLVKSFGPKTGRDWSGYVNGVLRALLREAAPALPDPAVEPATAFSIRYSCPRWLTERWVRNLGAEQAEAVCRATLVLPPLTLRANTLRITREALVRDLIQAGYAARPTVVSPVGVILEKDGPVTALAQFAAGGFYIEDEAAQLVPLLLDPQPGERVLDACAAPGGKTTHLAALMRNSGKIVALDRSPARLRLVEDNCRRLDVRIVTTGAVDLLRAQPRGAAGRYAEGRLRSLCARPFDRILLDAPCTGLGVLRRHPEGKWQKREEQILAHQHKQRDLLDRVSRLLRPGGVIVYSTCSTEPEETEQVIEPFCQDHPAFRRESVEPWLPPTGRACLTAQGALSTMPTPPACGSMDGFYAARLRKADR